MTPDQDSTRAKQKRDREKVRKSFDSTVARLADPCRELPPELTDDRVTDVSTVQADEEIAFAITFETERIPFGYWNPPPKGWRILDARLVREYPDSMFVGKLFGRTEPRMQILVSKSAQEIREDSPFGDFGNSDEE